MTLTMERPTETRATLGNVWATALRKISPEYARLEKKEKEARENLEFLKREREAFVEAARRGGLI